MIRLYAIMGAMARSIRGRFRVLIGLISDTHIPEAAPDIWPQVYEAFKRVDLILHAGDLHVIEVVDRLERLAPIYVARGNGDDGGAGRPVVADDPRLRES